MIKLAIVSPCYNEEAVLHSSSERLNALYNTMIAAGEISPDSFVLFVNDGSRDATWQIIEELHKADPVRFKGVDLAHNVGHQNAIMAGMMTARDMCDAVITIDADLQDDLEAIPKMVKAYAEGYDVVYGVKVQRTADPVLKRLSAQAFYKLQKSMGVNAIYNHADFRLLSRRVLDALAQYPEKNLYLRGIIPQIGFPSTTVDDVISPRTAGHSKYSLSKMLTLALNGITSFSVKPLYAILWLGIIFLLISLGIGVYVIYSLIVHTAVHGWASLMLSIWMVGGFILISLGVIGLYLGRIFNEVKARPLYHIARFLN
ncbi:MAG: glycosyltransferase family 2 protein [Muribaculaceae bacterium]|nr:glycosyltransferase family 2 protein [Muribaculaceae bacterium]